MTELSAEKPECRQDMSSSMRSSLSSPLFLSNLNTLCLKRSSAW